MQLEVTSIMRVIPNRWDLEERKEGALRGKLGNDLSCDVSAGEVVSDRIMIAVLIRYSFR